MLVTNSKYEEGTIVSFKLVNGDEIVGKLVQEEDDTFVVSTPLAPITQGEGIGLAPAVFTAKAEQQYRLSKKHVMLHAETVTQLADFYRERTSGIQTVRKPSIITG